MRPFIHDSHREKLKTVVRVTSTTLDGGQCFGYSQQPCPPYKETETDTRLHYGPAIAPTSTSPIVPANITKNGVLAKSFHSSPCRTA
jgi:hypothetical protein